MKDLIYFQGLKNGKSKIAELLEKSIGDFGCKEKLPITLLTAKKAASNAATRAATKRETYCYSSEPDTNTKTQ